MINNIINLFFLQFCVKSELEEQLSHKHVTVLSIEFDRRFMVSSQQGYNARKVLSVVYASFVLQ